MYLSDIFEALTYGELSNLALGGASNEGISPSDYKKVVSYVNLGLIELFKRFPVKTKTIDIQQYVGISTYKLKTDFALNSGSIEPIKYLLDTADDPFTAGVLKIETVKDNNAEDSYEENLPLNDLNNTDSLFTPTYDTISVPIPNNSTIMTVSYRAAHDKIIVTDPFDPETVEVDMPSSLLAPLLYFIASRVNASKPSLDGNNESIMYLQKFEAAVVKIRELDLINDQEFSRDILDDNGWA